MVWEKMYALGYLATFENKERNEILLVGNLNNKIEVSVNHKPIGTAETELGAKEVVMKYMQENP